MSCDNTPPSPRGTFYLTGWVPEGQPGRVQEGPFPRARRRLRTDSAGDVDIHRPNAEVRPLPHFPAVSGNVRTCPTITSWTPCSWPHLHPCSSASCSAIWAGGSSLALIGLFLWKRRGWLGGIIACCGCSGAVFGCIYNSVFGFEGVLPGRASPSWRATTSCSCSSPPWLWACMLAFVMVLNILNGVRQKNYEKDLFGSNGAAGMVFIWACSSPAQSPCWAESTCSFPLRSAGFDPSPAAHSAEGASVRLLEGKKDWYRISWGQSAVHRLLRAV